MKSLNVHLKIAIATFFLLVAVMLIDIHAYAVDNCETTVQKAQTQAARKVSLKRPRLMVVTKTNYAHQLALRWKTNNKAQGYLLKYKKDGSNTWKRIWIPNPKKSSYVLKDLKRASYTVRLKAYTKKRGTYHYSKNSSAIVNMKYIVQTVKVEEVQDAYVLVSCFNRNGKKGVQETISTEDLGVMQKNIAVGDNLLIICKKITESDPGIVDNVVSIERLT